MDRAREDSISYIALTRLDYIQARISTPTTPSQHHAYLSSPGLWKRTQGSEDAALIRIYSGYDPLLDWSMFNNEDANQPCPRSIRVNSYDVLHLPTILFARDLSLLYDNERSTSYVDYIIYAVNAIKFAKDWNALQLDGRSTKKHHIACLFERFFPEQHRKVEILQARFDKDDDDDDRDSLKSELQCAQLSLHTALNRFIIWHTAAIAPRAKLLTLFNMFGCAVLLDPFWDTRERDEPLSTATLYRWLPPMPVNRKANRVALFRLARALGLEDFVRIIL